jgi:hypothetical protein
MIRSLTLAHRMILTSTWLDEVVLRRPDAR